MSKVDRLCESYSNFIKVPWRKDAAPPQRVIFCVYDESDELKLRAKFDEFEIATRNVAHDWHVFDLTNTFAEWLSTQRYAERYFEQPTHLPTLLPKYLDYISEQFRTFLINKGANANSVVALKGVGTLFGLLKVKEVVDRLAPMVIGRLAVFFPGTFENNNYRLLDAYDGWDYHAVLITADKEV